MPASAAIYGCQGTELSQAERGFFREVQPWGFILFARNVRDPEQVRRLCAELRETVPTPDAPILIDQEGGRVARRVARLKPPHWRTHPPGRVFGDLFQRDPEGAREAAYLNYRLIAHELRTVGVNVDCAPLLDVPVEGAHDIIGDRAFSTDPAIVIELGRAAIEGFLDGSVLPVVKHVPGHGRATADSHLALPRVSTPLAELRAHDFVTFRSLNHAPLAMTAHVVYEALDPQRPATTSPKIIRDVIRDEMGFDGLLMSDDLSMQALEGPFAARTKATLSAGCDVVLHCNGRMEEMTEIAEAAKPLAGAALRRADAALALLKPPGAFDVAAAEARLAGLIGAFV
jgi:beta-N-acetylhexosaminidase